MPRKGDALMNEEEAKRLVKTYADMILRICVNYLRNRYDAEDICQNVFLKLIMLEKRFESREHEKAWIIRTSINECRDILKSPFKKRLVKLDEAALKEAPAINDTEMLDALMKLPVNYRMSIYLYYYEGYSVKEIALILKKSENVISSYLCRGRKKLKEQTL